MQIVAAVAVFGVIGVSIVVGIRLLLLHRRTRGVPELLLGLMLLLSVGLGYSLLLVASRADANTARVLATVSPLSVSAGFSLLYAFNWRVFRPDAAWARAAALAGIASLALVALWRCWGVAQGNVLPLGADAGAEALLQIPPVFVAYLWTSWESLHYHRLMQRRGAVGLADPVVANRFLLWGLMGLSATVGVLINAVAHLMRVDILTSPAVLLLSSGTALAQAALMVLALMPPASYVGWVRMRTGEA